MSGNNNATVAIPGQPNWAVWWWNGSSNFQLDIVGFLAVLGESAVLANAQVAALSRLFYLPRILPAPQALIRHERPTKLPHTDGNVTGVQSLNVKSHVHHVASVLLGKEMPPHTVRCVEVVKDDKEAEKATRADSWLRGQPRQPQTPSSPPVKANANGPLTWVTLIGFFEALVLITASIVFGDGMSIVATILLAGLSSIVGVCNKWTLQLPKRSQTVTPPGDVVIRYPNGSFLVVKCHENVARELYFAPEEIEYQVKNPATYRLLSLVGTVMLMLSVIALANSKLQLQIAWAGAFIIINIAHWVAAALPQHMHWDLSCYKVQEQGIQGGPYNDNFTEALWKTILVTKSTTWVKVGKAAPDTSVWHDWLEDMKTKANSRDYRTTIGTLTDALWPHLEGKATVWQCPSREEFDAKKIWDRLAEDATEAAERNATTTAIAPPRQAHLRSAVEHARDDANVSPGNEAAFDFYSVRTM